MHPENYLERFPSLTVLILGDIMLDVYSYGSVTRISPEAPVPVFHYQKEEKRLGGAANVALNLSALGVRPLLCGAIGRDENGRHVERLLKEKEISRDYLFVDETIVTTVKTRMVANQQQLLRIDHETMPRESEKASAFYLAKVEEGLEKANALIISDYGKGVIGKAVLPEVIRNAREKNVYSVIDPKQMNLPFYQGADAMTPNHHEVTDDTGLPCDTDEQVRRAAPRVLARHHLKQLLITRGAKGMALYTEKEGLQLIPTFARSVYDVSGAGDTVIASFVAARASRAPFYEAAIIANHAAGIAVSKFGTAAPKMDEIRQGMNDL